MSGKQYKICPACRNWNDAGAFECVSCGNDLTNIRPVTKESAAAAQEQKPAEAKARICTECGFANAPQARKCEKCGEDLSDVPVSAAARPDSLSAREETAPEFEFVAAGGEVLCGVPAGMREMILGREAFLGEYLADRLYVSRQQAALALNPENYTIRNLSGTNPTFVDNRELESGKEYTFPYGTEIGLGGKVIGGSRQKDAAYVILRRKK